MLRVVILAASIVLLGSSDQKPEVSSNVTSKGVISISGEEFSYDEPIHLNGEWEFRSDDHPSLGVLHFTHSLKWSKITL